MAVKMITKIVEEKLDASDNPMIFNSDDLSQYIKQRLPQNEFTVRPTQSKIPAGFGPYFYKLPRELRDQIFSHLLVFDYLSLMCTSRAMKQEGTPWIVEEGIYRINVGFRKKTNCPKPSQEMLATIQNVDIRISHTIRPTSTLQEFPELQFLNLFAGSAPHRRMCTVFFEPDAIGYATIGHKILLRLGRFKGFEKVRLLIGMTSADSYKVADRSDDWLDSTVQAQYWGLDWARECLEPSLGKADLRSDEDSWIMTFYPCKSQEVASIMGGDHNLKGKSWVIHDASHSLNNCIHFRQSLLQMPSNKQNLNTPTNASGPVSVCSLSHVLQKRLHPTLPILIF